jgi:hypothetical protein
MKALMATAAAVALLAGISAASAQAPAAGTDKSIHQSAGDRDSRGTPKRYTRVKTQKRVKMDAKQFDSSIHQSAGDRDSRGTPKRYTSGSGPRVKGPVQKNDPSIHQSAGDRDSRGNPKEPK